MASPEVKLEKPDPNVRVVKQGAHRWLVLIGILVLAAWVGVLVLNRTLGSETKEVTEPAAQTATGSTGATGATGATTKTTETKEFASETLLSALLGVGAALILVGFLYARISAIKLPGGVEILTEKEKETASEGIKEGLPADTDQEKTVTVTQEVDSAVRRAKAAYAGEIPPAAIKAIAKQVASEAS